MQHTLQHRSARSWSCPTSFDTATHCNTLQNTATHGSTLQHTTTHCHELQHTATHGDNYTTKNFPVPLQRTASHCNTFRRESLTRSNPFYQSLLRQKKRSGHRPLLSSFSPSPCQASRRDPQKLLAHPSSPLRAKHLRPWPTPSGSLPFPLSLLCISR